MESGKTLLVVLVSVVSTYVAITAWPAIRELVAPEISGSAVAAAPVTTTDLPSAPALSVPTASVARNPSPPASGSSGRSGTPKRGGPRPADISQQSARRLPSVPWDYTRMKYARVTVVLRLKPGGEALRPVSLNRAPLTVLRGTRLMPVKDKDDWVMVQAPSAELGWVHSRELTDTRPVTRDHYSLR